MKSIVSINISISISTLAARMSKSQRAAMPQSSGAQVLRCSGAQVQVLTERRLRCKSTAAERKLFSFYILDNAKPKVCYNLL